MALESDSGVHMDDILTKFVHTFSHKLLSAQTDEESDRIKNSYLQFFDWYREGSITIDQMNEFLND